MSPALLCCMLLLPAQGGKLELVNPRTTYGYLGAPRPKEGALPGDTVHFTFEIKNLKLDGAGKASYSIAIEIRDADGKLMFEQRPYKSIARNYLGGASLPCSAHVDVPRDAKPGPVNWKVTVVDRATQQSAELAGKGLILPADFGIVRVGLFADAETRVPMSAVGVVGDSAYLQLSVIDFVRNKETNQPAVKVSLRILDENGKATMKEPITGKIDADVPAGAATVPIMFGITLNRAGRFTLEVTAEDSLSGKTARMAYAIRVLPLE